MGGARRFSVSTPDWGQAHLSLDAIVAYVDDELSPGAHTRAEEHLARCAECAAEVVAQRQARSALRGADGPRLPSSLLSTLRAIPDDAELPPPPPGLSVTPDGQFVLLRDVPPGAMPPGDLPPAGGDPSGRAEQDVTRFSRRARIGGVAGLAFGALAVGALVVPGPSAPSPGAVPPSAVPARGVLGGSVLDVPAQVRISAVPSDPAPAARTVPPSAPVLVVEPIWRDAAVK